MQDDSGTYAEKKERNLTPDPILAEGSVLQQTGQWEQRAGPTLNGASGGRSSNNTWMSQAVKTTIIKQTSIFL